MELKDKISGLNNLIQDKYREVLSLDKDQFRHFIEENIGSIDPRT